MLIIFLYLIIIFLEIIFRNYILIGFITHLILIIE